MYAFVGYAHGFVTLENNSENVYGYLNYYLQEKEGFILWNETNVGIDWSAHAELFLSDKSFVPLLLPDFDILVVLRGNS